MRAVAAEQGVTLIDLNKRSDELLRREGPELSRKIYIYVTAEDSALPKPAGRHAHVRRRREPDVCMAVDEIKAAAPGSGAFPEYIKITVGNLTYGIKFATV